MSNLEDRVTNLEALVARLVSGGAVAAPTHGAARPAATDGDAAPDSDLDSKWGDPEIKKDPPRWAGASYVCRHYSQCPPEYLDEMASFLTWKAGKNEEDGTPDKLKYAGYDRKDAARARGWARRLRAAPPAPAPTDDAVEYAANGGEYPADMPF